MAVSLEARVPILDHEVVEFAMSLPSALKMRNGGSKWILRQAIRGLVPDSVLEKPKQGFAVPLDHWFRGPLQHRLRAISAQDARIHQWVDSTAVSRLVSEHMAGRRDHQGILWRLVVLEGWLSALAAGDLAGPQHVHDLLRRTITKRPDDSRSGARLTPTS